MERGTTRILIATAIIVGALVASVPFLGLFAVLFGAMIADCALIVVLFVPRTRLGTLRANPEDALTFIAHGLRLAQYRVKPSPGRLSVWVGRGGLVEIEARGTAAECEITWKAYATPGAWGTVATLIVLAWTAMAAIPVVVYLYFRAAAFVRKQLLSMIPADGAIPASFHPDDISVLLVAGLAEGHRLAEEAYELERTTYQDHQGIVLLIAILTAFLLLAWVLVSSPEPDLTVRFQNALQTAILSAVALGGALALFVRLHFRPRILRFREWSGRLAAALEREVRRETPAAEAPSAFELLSSATIELPRWLDATRRAGLAADFGMWTLLFLLALSAFQLFWYSAALALSGVALYFTALLSLGGVGLSAVAYTINRRWKERQEQQIGAEMTRWQGRLETTRAQMEQFLKDL